MAFSDGDVLTAGSVNFFEQQIGSAFVGTDLVTTLASSPLPGSEFHTMRFVLNTIAVGSSGVERISIKINDTNANDGTEFLIEEGDTSLVAGGGVTVIPALIVGSRANTVSSGLGTTTGWITNTVGQVHAKLDAGWHDFSSASSTYLLQAEGGWRNLGVVSGISFTRVTTAAFQSGTTLYVYGTRGI